MDADKSKQSLERTDCQSPLSSLSKDIVEILLDISEEKQDVCEISIQTGWDEAIQGWGQCSPFSCLFTAQQRSKKHKSESKASHCVLCSNLKDLSLSENHGGSQASYKASKEHSRSKVPSALGHRNRTPSTVTAASSPEEKISDITLSGRSLQKDLMDNNPQFGPDQNTPDKLPSCLPQPDAPCLLQEDRNAGKAVLPARVIVLPPVKVPPNPNTHPKNSHLLKRRDESGDKRPVSFSEKAGVDREQEKDVSNPYSRPTSQERAPLFQTQYQYRLLSDFPNPRGYKIPINTLAETEPSAPFLLERNLKQEELTMSSIQHKSGQRSRVGVKDKSLRQTKPQLLTLQGTRIQIPAYLRRGRHKL